MGLQEAYERELDEVERDMECGEISVAEYNRRVQEIESDMRDYMREGR